MVKGLDSLKTKIEKVLRDYPETRSSDTLLCIRLVQSEGGQNIEDLEKFNVISVHKLRQIIQNKEGNYLPSDEVKSKREERQERMREYFGRYR